MNNNKNNRTSIPAAATMAIAALLLGMAAIPATVQQAFAHAHVELTLTDEHVAGKTISLVLGHTNEPTFGAKAGIHDGKHGLEVTLSDGATELPLAGAQLKADKDYLRHQVV